MMLSCIQVCDYVRHVLTVMQCFPTVPLQNYPTLGRWWQKDYEFKANLGSYVVQLTSNFRFSCPVLSYYRCRQLERISQYFILLRGNSYDKTNYKVVVQNKPGADDLLKWINLVLYIRTDLCWPDH